MSFAGNILWFVFGGWLLFLMWCLSGIIMAITVIGIPFAIVCFRIAPFAAWPFGRELIDKRTAGQERKAGTGVVNIIWIVLFGLWISLSHILNGIFFCITIIGIPFGLAHFKLARVAFAPLGKVVVASDVAKEIRGRQVVAEVDEMLAAKD